MSMPAFTRGPWEAAEVGDYGDYDGNCRVILGDDLRVAVVLHGGNAAARAENDANAHLIAAAPDLYNGCNAMLGLVQLLLWRDDLSDEVRLALQTNHRISEAQVAVAKALGDCPGHVARDDDSKVCRYCGTHVDSERPDEQVAP